MAKLRKNERRRTCRASSEVFLKFRRSRCARRSLKKIDLRISCDSSIVVLVCQKPAVRTA
ncbi:hypothetical protein PTQ33_02730 [Campylobacter sp. 50012-21]|uniref:hypothetical protein n=1 Tax=Campylobacter magnus TaxID=3026462 RepID=UPI002362DA67|nr:hypothetical protein [Campylobacter magnus]MDD0846036.1 hypothetical protein [Campylobacter magnus]